ncbi:laccase [Moniliophthora roreri MCA 2997]|uniref:Laccase n=1 Tax=Moniliophthora roreri (strain MCA 2997) TaxID=1381753 RepID=V2XHV1_MONRO|nr:laccase [Moniliophthora roreri MCA 2997]
MLHASIFGALLPVTMIGLLAMASVIGPKADLRIVNARVSPDGFSRVGALADGSFPGPVITSTKGVGLEINVIDELTDDTMTKSTSIHWHGLIMKGRNWADGPTSVNQCPISPGHSFKYELPAGDQAGTFWYHSHLSTQYCDGLRGALVVYDPEDPHRGLYDVDDENTIITLVDWYHDPSPSYVRKSFQAPDSTLINGLGRYKGGPSAPLAVINVKRGKRYRFRLISMACDPNFHFSIDRHNLTVIEVDGVNHQPLVVDSIQIFAGQRYSFVLHADGPVDNYWIRAKPDVGNQDFKGGINQAILRYKGAAETDPTTESGPSMNQLMETDLHPLENPGAPGLPQPDGADINLNFALGFNPSTRLFDISGTPFIPPTVPVLLQIMSGAAAPGSLLPNGPVYALPLNKTIQISFPPGNAPGAPHPMHLHGHTFDVIRSAGSSEYNYVNPVRRDVVNTGVQEDNVTIRFKTDNAGPWFLHCHIDLHLEHGLAVVLAEDAPGTAKANLAPDSWKELCPIYEAEKNASHAQSP